MLVDTSIWVEYFRHGNIRLARHLQAGTVRTHPMIIGELACGRFRDRESVFNLLHKLVSLPAVTHDEALRFVELHDLARQGLGWVDVHVLASARFTGAALWTDDGALARAARQLTLKITHG